MVKNIDRLLIEQIKTIDSLLRCPTMVPTTDELELVVLMLSRSISHSGLSGRVIPTIDGLLIDQNY